MILGREEVHIEYQMQADYCPEEEEQEESIVFKGKTPAVGLCPLSTMTIPL